MSAWTVTWIMLGATGWVLALYLGARWQADRERLQYIREEAQAKVEHIEDAAERRVRDVKEEARDRQELARTHIQALQTFMERESFEERTAEAVETPADIESEAQARVDEADVNRLADHILDVARGSGRQLSEDDAKEHARELLHDHRQRSPSPF